MPLVIAHRGASAAFPENTLPAFDAALRRGCDGIELDVQLSSDGVPVVYHDTTLERAGGGRRHLSRTTLAELRGLDAGGGARIPTLDRVLERYARRTTLLIEVKVREIDKRRRRHEALARAVLERLRSGRLWSRTFLLCFDPETLAIARGIDPRVRCVLNARVPRRMNPLLRRALEGCHALSADIRTLTPAVADAARALGVQVFTYTCNRKRAVRRALECEVDAIMSDRPRWLRELL